jgi:hypothetical protein
MDTNKHERDLAKSAKLPMARTDSEKGEGVPEQTSNPCYPRDLWFPSLPSYLCLFVLIRG